MGILFELVMGVLLTLLTFFMADFLATEVFQLPKTKVLIEVASLTILADSFLKICQSTFIGLKRMEFHSLTMILNSGIRCILALLLVFLSYGKGAIQGQIVAQVTTGIIGIIIFYAVFLRGYSKKDALSRTDVKGTPKTLFKYGLHLSVSAVIGGFLPQFCNTLFTQSFEAINGANYTTALATTRQPLTS